MIYYPRLTAHLGPGWMTENNFYVILKYQLALGHLTYHFLFVTEKHCPLGTCHMLGPFPQLTWLKNLGKQVMREDRRERQRREWIQSFAYIHLPLVVFICFYNKARLLPVICDPSITRKKKRYHWSNHIQSLIQMETCCDTVALLGHRVFAVELLPWPLAAEHLVDLANPPNGGHSCLRSGSHHTRWHPSGPVPGTLPLESSG